MKENDTLAVGKIFIIRIKQNSPSVTDLCGNVFFQSLLALNSTKKKYKKRTHQTQQKQGIIKISFGHSANIHCIRSKT